VAGRDWIPLKSEYTATNTSLREMAEKTGIPFNTIRDRAFKDKWGAARKEYRDKLIQSTIKKIASRQASECAKQLASVGKSAELATRAIERMMGDDQQFQRHIVQVRDAEGAQDVQERVYEKMDTKALRELAATLKDLVAVIRDVNGLPTLQEQKAMELADKRLQLDQQQAIRYHKLRKLGNASKQGT
jgi:pyoverdine/dityrosine biosynthesis protein Dit1